MRRLLLLLLLLFLSAQVVGGCGEEVGPGPVTEGEPSDPTTTQLPDQPDPTANTDTTPPDVPDPEAPFAMHVLEPTSGRTLGGELVVIEGSGFIAGMDVYFGSRKAPDIIVYSSQIIHARTPSHKPGVVDVKLQAPNSTVTVKPAAYVFRDDLSVTGVEPAVGPTKGGSPVTVRGHGFTADTKVIIGSRLLIDLTVVDSETIYGIVPAGPRGETDVIVGNPLTSTVLNGAYRYTAAPEITWLEPSSAPIDQAQEVAVIGENMGEDTVVRIDGEPVEIVATSIFQNRTVVRVEGGAAGIVDVEVETNDGLAQAQEAFVFYDAEATELALLNVWPRSGSMSGGNDVALTLTGLGSVPEVYFGAEKANVVDADFPHLTVVVPAGSGVVDIKVKHQGAEVVQAAAYEYLPLPVVHGVVPGYGPIQGGTQLTITGKRFGTDPDVFVGALPATVLSVEEDTIVVLTPPGSPGLADVRVAENGDSGLPGSDAVLEKAFDFRPLGGPEVYAIHPTYGGIAGGTLVRIFGAGFTLPKVRFAKLALDSVDVRGSSELRVRSPYADESTVLNVSVEQGGHAITLTDAYAYFDPTSPYGGSWGPPIEGTVNVTVLDLFTTDPIPEALVILGNDPDTKHRGFTDGRGQIILSDLDIVGAQMITAAKKNHTAYSVVEYDAENVTVHLINLHPSDDGGGGGGSPPNIPPFGELDGKVSGLGKYLVLPPGVTGRKTAWCQSTTPGLWEDPPKPNTPDSLLDYTWVDSEGYFDMKLHLTELAIVCLGGVVTDEEEPKKSFVPLMMGVARNIQPKPGEKLADLVDIQLSIPLKRTIPIRLDGAPTTYVNPGNGVEDVTRARLRVALDFGPDGFWTVMDREEYGSDLFQLAKQPVSLVDDLDGVTYAIEATVKGKGNQAAITGTQHFKVKFLETDRLFSFVDGAWNIVKSGIPRDAHATWGPAPDRVWLVGQGGLIAHGKNGSWFPQYSPTTLDLNGVWGVDYDHAVAVGDLGTVVAFDGSTWALETTDTTANLHAVWGQAHDDMWAVGDGVILHRDAADWTTQHTIQGALHSVWGAAGGHVLAGGDNGTLWQRTGNTWASLSVAEGVSLRGIHGTGWDHAMIVGDNGTVLKWNGSEATAIDVPTTERLNAVHVSAPDEVFCVGDRGAMLRFDGNGWAVEQAPAYGGDLKAVWDLGTPEAGTIAAGTQVISVGPILQFPVIDAPSNPALGQQSSFDYHMKWHALPGHEPTFNFVEMMMGWGNYFPAWWHVVDAQTTDVTLPHLPTLGIDPFLEGNAVLFVHRVYKPGTTADNFDFWDTYQRGSWTSWATAQAIFTP